MADAKLRKRIAWLNADGGFENQIVYSKVARAAEGLDDAKAMEILKNLEEKWEKVWDPTSWVCSSMQSAKEMTSALSPDFDSQLRKRIRWLNDQGGFNNQIIYSKIAEAAAVNGATSKVMAILGSLEEKWENISDPTAWVCAALRKSVAADESLAGYGWQSDAEGKDPAFDLALRRRIRWLNTAGGFDNKISFAKISEAAIGVEGFKVMEVLHNLESHWEGIEDPTAWVCAALRRITLANQGKSAYHQDSLGWGSMEPDDASWGTSWHKSSSSWATNSKHGSHSVFRDRLWKRIHWLNTEGGFADQIDYARVEEQAVGLSNNKVFPLLTYLEANWDKVTDPTAWLCASLRKAWIASKGGGVVSPEFDSQLRRRIRWMNTEGGFEDKLSYSKIVEACTDLEPAQVMVVLSNLEEAWDRVIDPTAWVCAGLRKVAAKSYHGGSWMALEHHEEVSEDLAWSSTEAEDLRQEDARRKPHSARDNQIAKPENRSEVGIQDQLQSKRSGRSNQKSITSQEQHPPRRDDIPQVKNHRPQLPSGHTTMEMLEPFGAKASFGKAMHAHGFSNIPQGMPRAPYPPSSPPLQPELPSSTFFPCSNGGLCCCSPEAPAGPYLQPLGVGSDLRGVPPRPALPSSCLSNPPLELPPSSFFPYTGLSSRCSTQGPTVLVPKPDGDYQRMEVPPSRAPPGHDALVQMTEMLLRQYEAQEPRRI